MFRYSRYRCFKTRQTAVSYRSNIMQSTATKSFSAGVFRPETKNAFVSPNSDTADRLALCTGLQPQSISMANQVKSVAEETLDQISIVIKTIGSHDLVQETPTAVTSFIHRELVHFLRLLEDAVKDLELLIKASSGHHSFTPGMFNLASSLGHRRAPSKWLEKRYTNVSLADWLENVGKQVKFLGEYLSYSPLHPSSFCLGAFAHPQAFLACVLMDHARSAMKSVYALDFSVEVRGCSLSTLN